MTLVELRDAVVGAFHTAMSPSGVKVLPHGGQVNEAEMRRWALNAPCIYVSLLGLQSLKYEGGARSATVGWGLFLITRDRPALKRDAAALHLLEAALGVLSPSERWGDQAGAGPPTDIAAANLYAARTDAMALSLWSVTWTQTHDVDTYDMSQLGDAVTYDTTIGDGDGDEESPTLESSVTLP